MTTIDLTDLTWTVPPECSGQMIETAYGWLDGDLYRRDSDRSSREVTYYRLDEEAARALAETSWHPCNSAPDADGCWTEEPRNA